MRYAHLITISPIILLICFLSAWQCHTSPAEEYKNFDKSTIDGTYVGMDGEPMIRFKLNISAGNLVTGWVLYRGRKRRVAGTMEDTRDLVFHFDLLEQDSRDSIKPRYVFSIYAQGFKDRGDDSMAEGERTVHIDGRGYSESFILLKAWRSKNFCIAGC